MLTKINRLNRELTNPESTKPTLERLWDAIQKVLPSAVNLATEFTKIISLIQ